MMKKVRLLLLIFAAVMVAQVSNAQTIHEEWVIPIENTWVYCVDENVTGELVYAVKYKFDKDGNLVRFSMQNKGGFLDGETSGNRYKIIDFFHEKIGTPPKEGEYMVVGRYKIIVPGQGVNVDGRVHINIDVDKNGELVIRKYVWDLCF